MRKLDAIGLKDIKRSVVALVVARSKSTRLPRKAFQRRDSDDSPPVKSVGPITV